MYLEDINRLHKSIFKHVFQYGGINIFLSRCEAFSSSPIVCTSWLHVMMIVVIDLWHVILVVGLVWILIILILAVIATRLVSVMLLIILHIWIDAAAVIIYIFLK